MAEYGENFEKPIIVISCLFMAVALALVVAMNVAYNSPECNNSDYTYCGEHH